MTNVRTIRTIDLMRPLKHIVYCLLACYTFVSCSKDTVFNEFQPIQNKLWDKQAVYYFNFEIKDKSIPYDVFLQLRNSNEYPYQNIWIFYEEQQAETAVRDTIEYMLADDFGKWKGNGITLFQSRIPLRNHYFFPDTGSYTISVQQGMRDNRLKGIEDIGLYVRKTK